MYEKSSLTVKKVTEILKRQLGNLPDGRLAESVCRALEKEEMKALERAEANEKGTENEEIDYR